jgi:hypothetical protein
VIVDNAIKKQATAIGAMVLVYGSVIFGGLIIGFPVKWLWNWLIPDMFGIKAVGFWQAWGLVILCGILFKSPTSSKA